MARALRIDRNLNPPFRSRGIARKSSAGMTLVEMMIVVAIAAILCAIAVPSYIRSRKRAQAMEVLEELRTLSSALEQYTHEHPVAGGTEVPFARLRPYLREGTRLYETGNDLIGNPHGPFIIDDMPVVNMQTYHEFETVADADFWMPYFRDPEE